MKTTTSTMTLPITGPDPQVAPGTIQAPHHPNLPATGAHQSLGLVMAGLVLIALVVQRHGKRHAWWLLLLAALYGAPQTVSASELPEISASQVSLWDVPPAKATMLAGTLTFGNNGFMAPTPYGDTIRTTVNTREDLTAQYGRAWLTDTFKTLTVTLRVWQVSPYVGGRYQAKLVHTDAYSEMQGVGVWNFKAPFFYTPKTPGTYFLQYTTNTTVSLTDATPVASAVSRLLVQQPTTALKITAPPIVFPSTGSPANPASATTTPSDATDRINWTASQHVELEHTSGAAVGFWGQANQIINWDAQRPGLPAALGATAGSAKAKHDFHIGGLAAIDTTFEILEQAPFAHTTQGLVETAAQLPPGRWQYDWQLVPTKKTASGLQLDLPNQKPLANFAGVTNPSGYTDTLSDTAVAFGLVANGALVKQLIQAASAGTPYAIQLTMQMQDTKQVYTLTSNYAGVNITKPQSMLSLIIPQKAYFEFTRRELYDETAIAPNQPMTLSLNNRYERPNWTLSVSLAARPAKKDFPFALLIGKSQRVDYDHPAAVIQTGHTDLKDVPIDLRLLPTPQASASLDKHFAAEIVWTVAQPIDAAGL